MTKLSNGIHWVDRNVKVTWGAVLFGAVVLLGISSLPPDVDPLMPHNSPVVIEPSIYSAKGPSGSAGGFVERPLFVTDRRPASLAVTVVADTVAEMSSSTTLEEMTDVVLLGVFSSNSSSGVIVSEKGSGKRRLYEGESLQGWSLVAVEPRAALFSDGVRTERLDMKLLSNLPSLRVIDAPSDWAESPNDASEAQAGEQPREKVNYTPSFDNQFDGRVSTNSSQATPAGKEETEKQPRSSDNER